MDNLNTILVTLLTGAFSAGAWQFYQSRLKLKHETDKHEAAERTMFRDDLRERVVVLEQKLEQSQREKEQQAKELSQVLAQLAEYKVRLELLEKENDRLRNV